MNIKIILLILLCFLIGSTTITRASETNYNSQKNIKEVYKLNGFRSAKFGYTKKQVLDSIKKDFSISKDRVIISKNKNEKTTIMTVVVPSFLPFGKKTKINYILGYKTNKLFQINVIIKSNAKNKKELLNFTRHSLSLLEYYNRFNLSDYRVIQGKKIKYNLVMLGLIRKKSPNSVLEFVLSDANVSMDNKGQIDVEIIKGKNPYIRLSYIQDASNLAIFSIKDGEF